MTLIFATEGYILMVLCQINLTFVEIISLYVRKQTALTVLPGEQK